MLLFSALASFLFVQKKFQLGLDVQGGVRFTYRIDTSSLTAEQRSNMGAVRDRLQRIMLNRATGTIGVAEPLVQLKGDDQLIIELPGFTDENSARSVLSTTASLEWYHATNVSTAKVPNRPYNEMRDDTNPDRPEVHFMRRNGEKVIKPGDPEYKRIIAGWDMILKGDELAAAFETQVTAGRYIPSFRFNSSGADKMRRWTLANRYKGEMLAAVLDGTVISIAPLQEGAVISDQGQIDGTFSVAYVKNLVELLNSGALPVSLEELRSERVDPTVGKNALDKIMVAGGIALGVIGLFLLVYYVFPGLVALLALSLYILFTLTVLKWAGATFSLAAIAGFVLSIAMAVDANILVFERVKEEIRSGKALMNAIELGFRRALPAIVDSNACTILTALVLANIGTGPVRGFASTLIIGVAISLFTAVTVTRSLLVFLVGSGLGNNVKWFGLNRQWFGEGLEAQADENRLHVVERWKRYFIISALPILPGILFLGMGGLKSNVEFQGGYEAVYKVAAESQISASDIARKLEEKGYKGGNAKLSQSETGRLVTITIPKASLPTNAEGSPRETLADAAGLSATPNRGTTDSGDSVQAVYTLPADGPDRASMEKGLVDMKLTGATVQVQESTPERIVYVTVPPNEDLAKDASTARAKIAEAAGLQVEPDLGMTQVGPSVQAETVRNAILGVVYSCGLIVLYLAFRFGVALGSFVVGLRFAFSAIGAMLHDVLVVLALAAITGYLLNWEISALFISAMLTVIGFSTHDTIVIFDRIRENLRRPLKGEDLAGMFNRSITQSIARSINTSMIVMVSLAILIGFGSATPDLMLFNATMLVGVMSGTYSSIFNAAPILYLWEKWLVRRKGEAVGLMATARAHAAPTRTSVVTPTSGATAGTTPAGYSQVKRRASAVERAQQNLDDEP